MLLLLLLPVTDDDGLIVFEEFLASYAKPKPIGKNLVIMAINTLVIFLILQAPFLETMIKVCYLLYKPVTDVLKNMFTSCVVHCTCASSTGISASSSRLLVLLLSAMHSCPGMYFLAHGITACTGHHGVSAVTPACMDYHVAA